MSRWLVLSIALLGLGLLTDLGRAAPAGNGVQTRPVSTTAAPRRTRRSYSYSGSSNFNYGFGGPYLYRGGNWRMPNYMYPKGDPRRYRN